MARPSAAALAFVERSCLASAETPLCLRAASRARELIDGDRPPIRNGQSLAATLVLRAGARCAADRGMAARPSNEESATEKRKLDELLTETRILLPGTQVFFSLLLTVPFTSRFDRLTSTERDVYLAAFFGTLLAFLCFVVPAAYHRIARPVHQKARFKVFANAFLVAGLVPMSIALVLAGYLVASVVVGPTFAMSASLVLAAVVAVLWWVLPLVRAHDRYPYDLGTDDEPRSSARPRSNVTSIHSRRV